MTGSKQTNCLRQLSPCGTFESRTGSQSAIYSIIPFVDDKRPQSDTQGDTQPHTQPHTQGDTQPHTQGERINKHKLNVNETKQKKENCVKEKSNVSPPKEKKIRFGEYQHVLLKQSEYDKLIAEFLNAEELIKYLDEYIEMKGYKANSHYLAIRKWVVNAVNEQNERSIKASGNSQNSNQFARIYQEMEKEGGGLGF